LTDGVQILYVSPLKALSNDIQKNLEQPLNGIAEQLHLQGYAPVNIRIAVRTGDTPPSERARMAKKPPHILVTTPESFYLLLTSASGRAMLSRYAAWLSTRSMRFWATSEVRIWRCR
jgi:ATP-dependent Lhr-like helicase